MLKRLIFAFSLPFLGFATAEGGLDFNRAYASEYTSANSFEGARDSTYVVSLRGYSKTGSPVIRTIEGDVELIAHNLELGTKSFITFHAGTGEYLEDLFLPSDAPRHDPFYADQDGLIWYQVRDDNDCYAAINEAAPQLISDRAQCQSDAETEFGIIGAEAIENPKSISGPLSENEDFLWLVDRFQGPVWQIDGTEIVIVDIREPCS